MNPETTNEECKAPERKTPVKKRRLRWRKEFVLLAAAAVLVLGLVGGTVAYIVTNTSAVKNEFTPGQVSCLIEETFSGGIKSVVTVKNTGNTPAYIRVAVVGNAIDADGKVTGNYSPVISLGDGWVQSGNYYYYTSPVSPSASTGNLLSGNISVSASQQVTILADAIQATPVDAVTSAWGVNPGSLGGGSAG